jgi:hypothetical protein
MPVVLRPELVEGRFDRLSAHLSSVSEDLDVGA